VLPFDHGARLNRPGGRQGILPTNHDIGRLDEARLIEFGRSAVAARKRRRPGKQETANIRTLRLPRQKSRARIPNQVRTILAGRSAKGGVPK
jgi:hypothetical protein